jgi:hypothetical protein
VGEGKSRCAGGRCRGRGEVELDEVNEQILSFMAVEWAVMVSTASVLMYACGEDDHGLKFPKTTFRGEPTAVWHQDTERNDIHVSRRHAVRKVPAEQMMLVRGRPHASTKD